jgi:hypothetical protein
VNDGRAHLEGTATPASTVEEAYWAWSDSRVVSTLHRRGHGLIERVVPERHRVRAHRFLREQLHRGDRVECPICGHHYRHFMAQWNDENAVCWHCGSQEWHRTLWLFLTEQRPDLLAGAESLLHFAPEPGIEEHLRPRVPRYLSADIDPGVADIQLDITKMNLDDESLDAIICSHILEHVPDDAAAMSELFRVLRPGGWAVVLVPLARDQSETYEDPSIVDPVARKWAFWQEDHVRLYAPDIADRLRAAGFHVEHLRPTFGGGAAERYRLGDRNDIFLGTRPEITG